MTKLEVLFREGKSSGRRIKISHVSTDLSKLAEIGSYTGLDPEHPLARITSKGDPFLYPRRGFVMLGFRLQIPIQGMERRLRVDAQTQSVPASPQILPIFCWVSFSYFFDVSDPRAREVLIYKVPQSLNMAIPGVMGQCRIAGVASQCNARFG